jgi:methylmalonyl-CoA mutase
MIDRGEEVIVGVNKYRPETEDEVPIRAIDNHAVRAAQTERLRHLRATRDEAAVQAALDALREGARSDGNLLALAIPAARARATVGEISQALEDVFGRHPRRGPHPSPASTPRRPRATKPMRPPARRWRSSRAGTAAAPGCSW